MQNYILDDQIHFYDNSGLLFYPGVLINNQSYLGNFKSVDVFEEVCNSMLQPPYECRDYVEGYVRPQQDPNEGGLFQLLVTIFYVLLASSLIIIIAVHPHLTHLTRPSSTRSTSSTESTTPNSPTKSPKWSPSTSSSRKPKTKNKNNYDLFAIQSS